MSDAIDERVVFAQGLALFNAGEFFEAHEVWEDVWNHAQGERKRFYQGLIQCAVTLEHVRRGNPRGVVTVFASACEKLHGIPCPYLGVDHAALVDALTRFIAPIRALPREMFAVGRGRGLQLPVDLKDAPRLAVNEMNE
jgi:predicted metal-dependent hydrolase